MDKLPKNLGLSSQCKKGFFPHKLNTINNYNLVLPHCPDRELYEEWKMDPQRKVEFDEWFKTIKHKSFNFRQEILDYCLADAVVLHAAVLKFVKMGLQLEQRLQSSHPTRTENFAGGDRRVFLPDGSSGFPKAIFPFSRQSWTLSGYTSLLMRKIVLPAFPKIPILKHEDQDVGMQKSSREELLCLLYLNLKKYKHLVYGLRSEEQKTFSCVDRQCVPPITRRFEVDGYDPESQTVIEYLGCFWHSHRKSECYTPTTNSHGGFSLDEARARTEHRLSLLKNHDDVKEVMVIYSCRWQRFLKENPNIRQHLQKALGPGLPLNLRSVFRGGVVGCFCAYFSSRKICKCATEAFGRPPPNDGLGTLLDVNSFYPALLASVVSGFFEREEDRVKLPYGPPTHLRTHELCMSECPPNRWPEYVGAASVRILPPRNCRFPILRCDILRNKQMTQMAALCRSCAESASFLDGASCSHEEEKDRWLEGSFTLLELVYALEKQDYKLLEVYEIHYYEDHTTTFLEKFLEGCAFLKVVSEGFPTGVVTPQEKETHVQKLSQETGLNISVEDIMESPALRTGGKMAMNATIGKLGQKIIRDSKFYVQEYQDLANLRMDKTLTIKGYSVISDKTVKVTTQTDKSVAKPFKGGNLLVAAQCTAAARRELVKFLTLLENNRYVVCYSDTDSFLTVPLHPDCPPVEELVRVDSRQGSLKVEHSGIKSYTGLLKKAYVFSKRIDAPSTGNPPNGDQTIERMEEDSADSLEAACHVLAKADRSLYPQPEPKDPSLHVTVKFKGISKLSSILKANDACDIIQDELLDVLASNPKPRYMIEQPRLLLNQNGKQGIWESNPENSFKRLAMNTSNRYFDLDQCTKIVELEEEAGEQEDQETEEGQQQGEERIMLGLRGTRREGLKTKKKRKIELGPFVLTQPYGYLPNESDRTSVIGQVLAQWRQSM